MVNSSLSEVRSKKPSVRLVANRDIALQRITRSRENRAIGNGGGQPRKLSFRLDRRILAQVRTLNIEA